MVTNTTNTTKRLVQAVQELSLARSMAQVMEIVRTVARELTGADGAAFVLRDRDFCYYADEDAISPLWKGSRFPMNSCISGWAMENKKSVVIPDIYKDERVPHEAYRPTFVKSLAMVPIRTIEPIGAIGNYWAHTYHPTEEQITLLQSLADITAVTIENVNVYNELEEKVRERTVLLEITNQELAAANSELEAFSYSVSHDLRAPLRSIMGYAEVINEDCSATLNDNGRKALNTIKRNANRMNTLIDDLLKFSKLGKKELAKVEVDSYSLVQDVISEITRNLNFKADIRLKELAAVQGDKDLLRQVWLNLLLNAIKYSAKAANPVIEINSYTTERAVVFFIKDNGVGFDMKYVDKLFGVFQRLHKTEEFEGTGVGLALVRRIIDKHGGQAWAEAKPNEGATFFFSIPL